MGSVEENNVSMKQRIDKQMYSSPSKSFENLNKNKGSGKSSRGQVQEGPNRKAKTSQTKITAEDMYINIGKKLHPKQHNSSATFYDDPKQKLMKDRMSR